MHIRNGKIGVEVFLDLETYYALEAMRKPEVPRGTFFGKALGEVVNFQKTIETGEV
ncbi:hypothetical protein [Methanosarcina sp. UBA5]|uniref:hypothetical protein n=1 Tax=Methanosarcina sp. UBA5 TaxID=1915593 RepID=UPI0025D7195D|nr:hypothetical protein [Methanosarcina sp. UBA5]